MPNAGKPKTGSKVRPRPPFEVNGVTAPAGKLTEVELRIARLPTGMWFSLPVGVVHGKNPGPVIWISAAIHGDELNGVPIIRHVLDRIDPAEAVRHGPGCTGGQRLGPRAGVALPARPARPQSLLSGLEAWFLGIPARAPLHDRDRRARLRRNRSAYRLRRPNEPAAAALRPGRPRNPPPRSRVCPAHSRTCARA